MWIGGPNKHPIVLHSCPVLSLTKENRLWLRLFRRTHQLRVVGFGGLQIEMVAFPSAGGVWDQDAKTIEALDIIEQVNSEILRSDNGRPRTRSNNKDSS